MHIHVNVNGIHPYIENYKCKHCKLPIYLPVLLAFLTCTISRASCFFARAVNSLESFAASDSMGIKVFVFSKRKV